MPTWCVTLNGDLADLKALATLGVGVTEEADAFVFRSPHFEDLTDARAVHTRSVELVEVFIGLVRVKTRDPKRIVIAVGDVVREDGSRRDRFVISEPARLTWRGGEVHFPAPGDPAPPSRPFSAWAAVGTREPNIARALRIFAAPITSLSLWNVYEVIRDDAGGNATDIVSKGLASPDELERFRSVHYPSALGEKARQAVEPRRPAPNDPMSLEEAQEFVTRLLRRWLALK
jgi:hypothetical protein